MTITTLFRYFLNLLTYHYQKKTTPNTQEMARLLGVHPFFMKDYIDGGKIYNAMKCATTISLLREYDMKSKGVGNAKYFGRRITERADIQNHALIFPDK